MKHLGQLGMDGCKSGASGRIMTQIRLTTGTRLKLKSNKGRGEEQEEEEGRRGS
jgi:hypothetical protein